MWKGSLHHGADQSDGFDLISFIRQMNVRQMGLFSTIFHVLSGMLRTIVGNCVRCRPISYCILFNSVPFWDAPSVGGLSPELRKAFKYLTGDEWI